ncbi:MAG: hypothetical protein NXH97_21655 [Rhodobacteraceae bacterium]|nr:hypothetical protein [Paracoccaceae bacterium]
MDREDRLLAYLQNRLPAEEREEFEAEMAANRGLAAEVAALRAVRAELAAEDGLSRPDAGWARLSAALDAESEPANLNRPVRLSLWQAAGLVVAAVMLWQIAIVPNLTDPGDAEYQTVTEDRTGPVLQVIFDADASMGEISALLRSHDGTILDGPSALGLYRIAFPDAARRTAASAALADRPDLVDTVTSE